MSLVLPAFVPSAWDAKRHARSWLNIREATGRMLSDAIRFEYGLEQRQNLSRLKTAFEAAGGQPADRMADVLAFPRRGIPDRTPAPRTVMLPMRGADALPPPEQDLLAAD